MRRVYEEIKHVRAGLGIHSPGLQIEMPQLDRMLYELKKVRTTPMSDIYSRLTYLEVHAIREGFGIRSPGVPLLESMSRAMWLTYSALLGLPVPTITQRYERYDRIFREVSREVSTTQVKDYSLTTVKDRSREYMSIYKQVGGERERMFERTIIRESMLPKLPDIQVQLQQPVLEIERQRAVVINLGPVYFEMPEKYAGFSRQKILSDIRNEMLRTLKAAGVR